MSFLNKTYTLDKDENYKELMESLGVSGEDLKSEVNFKPSLMLKKDGDQYILSRTNPEGKKELKFKDGVEFDEEVAPGIVAKSKFTVEDNVVTQSQTFDNVLSIIYRKEYSGDKLVTVITTNQWDGTARRYYKYFPNKTYIVDKDENFKELLESLGVSGEDLKVQANFKPSLTLKKEGDQYIASRTTPDGKKELKFKDGVEFDEEVAPGIVGKSKFTVEDNVVTLSQKFDDGLSIICRKEYSGDKLVMVFTTSKWDGTARRYCNAA